MIALGLDIETTPNKTPRTTPTTTSTTTVTATAIFKGFVKHTFFSA
jgi:hypothetical protein